MAEGRGGHAVTLGVAAFAWTVWCLLSAAPVSLIVRLAATLLRRPALAEDVVAAVLVEMLLLSLTALAVFRGLTKLDPPARFWIVGPAGYVASFVAYLAIARLGGDTAVGLSPAALLEVVAVAAIVSAGAYLGGVRRRIAEAPADAGGMAG